jgi:hypothetical protein
MAEFALFLSVCHATLSRRMDGFAAETEKRFALRLGGVDAVLVL